MKQANDGIVAEILTMQNKISRLRRSISIDGYDIADIGVVADLYRESERINEQKKVSA